MRHNGIIGTLVIAASGTASTELTAATTKNKIPLGAIVDWILYAPTALTGTVTVQVAAVDAPASGDWRALQVVPGTDVTIAASKAIVIPCGGARALRVNSGSAEGADRTFTLVGQYEI